MARPAAPPAPPSDRCPRCGAPHDPYQEYCLECGARLPTAVVRRRETWRRESVPWGIAIVLAALIALAGAAGAVIATGEGTEEAAPERPRRTTEPVFTEPATITSPTGGATTVSPPTTGVTLPTTATTTTATTLVQWPAGKSGYTVVINSVPVGDGRAEAEAAARRALDRGLGEAGILDSSDFSSLRSGYYVAFVGVHDTIGQAERALPRARQAGFPLAYVREIQP